MSDKHTHFRPEHGPQCKALRCRLQADSRRRQQHRARDLVGLESVSSIRKHGNGSRLTDVDGNEYIDYLLGLGPMIFGHRPPKVTQAVVDFIQNRGTVFALPTEDEARLAQKIVDAIPSVDMVRLCNTGTEAVLYATRLARAFTKRSKIIRFEGMYHGFSDGVYWSKHPNIAKAGPEDHPVPVAQGPGMPKGVEENLIILPWNDADLLADTIKRHGDQIAAVLTEPVMCNTGCILPKPGYLEAMRELTQKAGIVLIFDEVITGFRLGLAGAQGRLRIKPDLSVFAKGIGGGFPVAAMGGRADIMALVANGTVSMAGTYSANGIAIAAANAAMDELNTPNLHKDLDAVSDELRSGLEKVSRGCRIAGLCRGLGTADAGVVCARADPQLPRRRAPRRPEDIRCLVERHARPRRAVPSGRLRKPVRLHRAYAGGHRGDVESSERSCLGTQAASLITSSRASPKLLFGSVRRPRPHRRRPCAPRARRRGQFRGPG